MRFNYLVHVKKVILNLVKFLQSDQNLFICFIYILIIENNL